MKSLKTLITALACFFALASVAQSQADNNIYTVVEEMPQFPGGDSAMVDYLTHNLHYPPAEKEKGIQGKVFVGFVIEKDGAVNQVEIKRGIGEECDAEAVRVLSAMPKWTPGMQSGKVVRVKYTVPINFNLK